MAKKKLFKSKGNKVLAGIFGGLGDYFDIDPTILRLGWLVIFISTGMFPGLIAYFIAILVVPKKV